MKLTITKEFGFDASHRLNDINLSSEENKKIFGKCNNEPSHGHTYKLFIEVSGHETNGMIINFTKLKEIVNKEIIEEYDHHFLNDCESLKGQITTCENMIKVIWNKLNCAFNEYGLLNCGIILESIKLYETPTSFAMLVK